MKCALHSFLAPANVAADVSGVGTLAKFAIKSMIWANRIATNLRLLRGAGRHILEANYLDARRASAAVAGEYFTGAAGLAFPSALVGDAADGLSAPSAIQDAVGSFVPGSNTVASLKNIQQSC
jgi:hypothetical protein